MNSILEIHNEKEMEIALNFKNALLGINNRNLENFTVSLDTTINIYKEFESALKNKIVISSRVLALFLRILILLVILSIILPSSFFL